MSLELTPRLGLRSLSRCSIVLFFFLSPCHFPCEASGVQSVHRTRQQRRKSKMELVFLRTPRQNPRYCARVLVAATCRVERKPGVRRCCAAVDVPYQYLFLSRPQEKRAAEDHRQALRDRADEYRKNKELARTSAFSR